MNDSTTVDEGSVRAAQARKLLWPVAVIVFLFTVSYPAKRHTAAGCGDSHFPRVPRSRRNCPRHRGRRLRPADSVGSSPRVIRCRSAGALDHRDASCVRLLGRVPPGVGCRRSPARLGRNQRDQGSPVVTGRVRDRVARRDFQRLRASAVLLISKSGRRPAVAHTCRR